MAISAPPLKTCKYNVDFPETINPNIPPSITSKRLKNDMRRSRYFLGKISNDIYEINKKFNSQTENNDIFNYVPAGTDPKLGAHSQAQTGHIVPGSLHDEVPHSDASVVNSGQDDQPVNNICNNVMPPGDTVVNQIIVEPAGSTGLYTQYFALSKMPKLRLADNLNASEASYYNDYYIHRPLANIPHVEEEESSADRVKRYIANHESFYNYDSTHYEMQSDPFSISTLSILYSLVTLLIVSILSLYCNGMIPQILAALIVGFHILIVLWSEPESMKVYVSAYWLISILTGSGLEYMFDIIMYLFDPFYKKIYTQYFTCNTVSAQCKLVKKWAKRGGAYILSWCSFILFAQKIRKNVSKHSINHINLRGIKTLKSHKKFPAPDQHKIPIRFKQGLPFISLEIDGLIVDALIDTGCQYNILNRKIYDTLISKGNEFEHFTHNTCLASHSGPELSLYQKAARIPIKFLSDGIKKGKEKQIPFLIENSMTSTNILGMKAINALEIEFGPGFKFLNMKLSPDIESPPLGWKVDPESTFSGLISLSCNSPSLTTQLEANFEGLREYTGCLILADQSNDSSSIINGLIIHLTNGSASYELSVDKMSRFPFKGKYITGRLATCTENCPSNNICLAMDIESGEPIHYFVNNSNLMMEVDQINELKSWLYQENAIPEILAPLNSDPSQPDPDLQDSSSDPIKINLDTYTYPNLDQLTREDLEINILDPTGLCLLCPPQACLCTPSNLKNKIIHGEHESGRIYTVNNKIILCAESEEDLMINVKKLANAVIHYTLDKKFKSVRLGNKIKYTPGLAVTLSLFDAIINAQKLDPDIKPILYKTVSSGSVHELQFNVQNGQLEHRPELLSKTEGLTENLLNPSEIAIVQEYEDDIKEVIKESSPDLHKFLFTVFNNYNESYISSPTDFGCLKHPDFMLDLKLKDNCEHLLPRHSPFHANAHMCTIVDKLCNHWTSIGLAAPSNVTSHCSRLLIVHKKVSNRNFEGLKSEIESSSNYRFKTNLPSELYSVDPDLLTVKQIGQIYRICLDSRDLNRICTDTVQRSQNPEICLQNLQKSIGKTNDASHNTTDFDQLRISDPFASYDFNYTESESGRQDIKKEIDNVNIDPNQNWFYSSIDISSAHTSVRLTDRAQFYLNFITPSLRILHFVRAIFGLKAISSQFNGSLTSILRDLVSAGHIFIYADDILIVSRDIKTHLSVIAEISRRFARHGLKINLRKSKFGVHTFSYIGYLFTPSGIFLSQDRIDAITSFPRPTNKKGVQRLLGMLNFIQKCIPAYSFHLFPLLSLLSDKKFRWTSLHDDALNRIKNIIKNNLSLHYVPEDEQLTLFVDSSAVAGGGVLFAGEPNSDNYRPILYLSKKYSELEIRRSSALECEISMLLYALEKCQYFSNGIHPIKVRTDAKTIIYLLFGSRKTRNPKLGRMASKISEFLVLYDIQYEKPNIPEMMMADAISRLYYDEVQKYPGDLIKRVHKDDISIPPPGLYNFQDLENFVLNTDCIDISKYIPSVVDSTSVADPVEGTDTSQPRSPGADQQEGGILGSGGTVEKPDPQLPASHPEIFNDIIGTEIEDNDVFFRFHSVNTLVPPKIDDLSWKNIIIKQQEDKTINPIRNKFSPQDIIEENTLGNYALIKGVLYRKDNEQPGTFKIYLPDSLLHLTISSSHIQFGHMGYVKLIELLNMHFYNPDLSKTAKNIISKCHLCTLANPNCLKKQKIQAFRYASQPGEVLGLDFMKLKKDCGHEYILVICDLFSGFTFLKPTVDQTADSAIKALKEVFEFVGPPNSIRSDGQMSLIKSKKMKSFFAENKIVGEIYPPNYVNHNPRTERTIRTVRELIRYANLRDKNYKWFKAIKMYNTILNSIPRKLSFNNQTHFLSPFEIYFSRSRPVFKVATSSRFSNYNVHPSSLLNESIKDFARGALVALKADYIEKTNKKGRDSVIKIGDCYVTINKKTPKEGGIPIKYQPRYNKNIYLCKRILGKNIIGVDILTGLSNYTCVDNIKVIQSRESYFSELPANIKKELGSSLDLKLDLNSRRQILQKLKQLKMYSKISSPVKTLKSSESSSGSSEKSGSTGLIPTSLNNQIPIQDLTSDNNLGYGASKSNGSTLRGVQPRKRSGFAEQEDKISQHSSRVIYTNQTTPGSVPQIIDPIPPSPDQSPTKIIIQKGKNLKNKLKQTLQGGSATQPAEKTPRPKRIRNRNRPKNRDPDFIYE